MVLETKRQQDKHTIEWQTEIDTYASVTIPSGVGAASDRVARAEATKKKTIRREGIALELEGLLL